MHSRVILKSASTRMRDKKMVAGEIVGSQPWESGHGTRSNEDVLFVGGSV
jgi:hypothetical protein